MATDALVAPLMRLPIFQGLEPEQLGAIVRAADRVLYRSGDVIAAENQAAEAAIVLISGRCFNIEPDNPRGGEVLPEGTIIAELGMLVETEHASTVIAQSRVKAMRLTRSAMLGVMEADPGIAEHFIDRIVGRLKSVATSLAAIDEAFGGPVDPISVAAYGNEQPATTLSSL